ncbi:MAG: serine/threonine protein phosphatase [Ruminococcaceae bacterium]|nr:serine/threonine protein phosphatase [Oscillospiraceae bacterium]
MKRKVKFGVFADLHVDIMHDTQERLEKFLEACRKDNVDFIIQLGDFCYPDDNRKCVSRVGNQPENIKIALSTKTYADKEKILSLFNNFEKPSYHVLGNHECDICSKKETMDFYEMKGESYYSFDMGGIHFIVLDPNYFKFNGEYTAFENGNYFDAFYDSGQGSGGEHILPWIPPEQIEWLKNDLKNTKFPSVLFSHQCLCEGNIYGALNADVIRQIIKDAPSGVLAAFNGHEHMDYDSYQDGICFVNINSMSCQWIDKDFICYGLYGKDIDEKYPNIKYTVPYKDSVYAIVSIDEEGIDIKGVESRCVGPSPEERGLYNEGSWWMNAYGTELLLTPSIKDRYIPLKNK